MINSEDLENMFKPAKHFQVAKGEKTADECFDDFADRLDLYGRLGGYDFQNGEMTYDEYMEFWDNISSLLRDNTVFSKLVNECFLN